MKSTSLMRAGVLLAATMITATGLLPTGAAAAAGGWRMRFLPVPPGSPPAVVAGTDDKGSYSGHFSGPTGSTVITWNQGRFRNHGVPSGFDSAVVVDENASREVAVNARTFEEHPTVSRYRAFVLVGTEFQPLTAPPGYSSSDIDGINDRGDIVGSVFNDPRFGSVPVLWPAGDRAHPILLDIPGPRYPVDIDHDGTILLEETFGSTSLWKAGELRELVLPDGATESRAIAIEDGRVLAVVNPWGDHLWKAVGQSQHVPLTTSDLNSFGLVAGVNEAGPAVWTEATGVTTLPSPTPQGVAVLAGDNGEIAGQLTSNEYNGKPVVWRRG